MSYFLYNGYSCYYEEYGKGEPVIFLHGNTASSKMFELLCPLYQEQIRMILVDFLGNGKSDRVTNFPPDMWHDQALQTIALIEHLKLEKVHLIGSSGGAWTALNIALEIPEKIDRVVADSFDGRTLHNNFAEELILERNFATQNPEASQFYEWCQGADWKTVVDLDTEALLACAKSDIPLFCKDISNLSNAVLLLGSMEDKMTRKHILHEYQEMKHLMQNVSIHMFETGNHPAILSNAEEAAMIILDFLLKK